MPAKYSAIKYDAPFLKEVMFRLDFPMPIDALNNGVPQTIANKIIEHFPLVEPRKIQSHHFNLTGQSLQASRNDINEWVYQGKNREKALSINPTALTVSIKDYKTFDIFLSEITPVITELFQAFEELKCNRIGLRYVNIIDIPKEKDALNWKKYINPNMLSIIDFVNTKKFIARAFSAIELNFDGSRIVFQFGLANPDHPAPVKQKQYIIDIDAFEIGSFNKKEILEKLKTSHTVIQELFENSITDETRSLMRKIKSPVSKGKMKKK